MKKTPEAPYGVGVDYADPGYQADKKRRYPVDTAEHAEAADDYIGKGTDDAKYSAADLAKVKAHIAAACKKFGIGTAAAESKSSVTETETAAKYDDAAPNQRTSSGHDDNTKRKAVPMKTIEELRSRLAEIAERLTELGADTAERSMNEEEETRWDSLVAEREEATASVEKIEKRVEFMRGLVKESPKNTERGAAVGNPAFIRSTEIVRDVDEIRSESYSREDYTRKLADNAKRSVEAADYGHNVDTQAAQSEVDKLLRMPWKRADAEALAARVVATGDPVYERAFGKIAMRGSSAYLSPEEHAAVGAVERAMSVSAASGADGGYAVPFQLDPTVMLDNASTINPIRELARVEKIVGKEWTGVTSTGATVTRGSEAATAPDSSFTLGQPTLLTNRVQGFVPFSYEIDLEWNALRSVIGEMLNDAKAREEDSFLTGNGSGTAPGGLIATATSTFNTATASTFATADVYALETHLAPRWRSKGQFLANKVFYNKIRQFDSAGGSALWQRIGAGLPPELLGYAAHEASAMIATGSGGSGALATGDKLMMFGDYSNFLIADRIGMTVELIPQIFDASNGNRPTGQRGIYAIWMNNSTILVQDALALLVSA